MLKKFAFLIVLGAFTCAPLACKKKAPPVRPGELTAEQRTKLRQNAAKAYQQIVTDYPESVHVDEARERLSALQAQQRK